MKHLLLVSLLCVLWGSGDGARFDGTWTLDTTRSTAIDPWRGLTLDLRITDDAVTVQRTWSGTRGARGLDSMRVRTDGTVNPVPIHRWVDNRHLGVRIAPNTRRAVVAQWKDEGRTLSIEQKMSVITSQGETPLRIYSEYRLAPDGHTLYLMELRSTRPRPLHYVFTRK